jgi:hypothetical protein
MAGSSDRAAYLALFRPGEQALVTGAPAAPRLREPPVAARAFSLLTKSEAKLYIFVLTRFLDANRFPSLENAFRA